MPIVLIVYICMSNVTITDYDATHSFILIPTNANAFNSLWASGTQTLIIVGSGNGLMPNLHQAITVTNDDFYIVNEALVNILEWNFNDCVKDDVINAISSLVLKSRNAGQASVSWGDENMSMGQCKKDVTPLELRLSCTNPSMCSQCSVRI